MQSLNQKKIRLATKIKDQFLAHKRYKHNIYIHACMYITYFEAIDGEEATDDTFLQTGTENDDIILFIHFCQRSNENDEMNTKNEILYLFIKLSLCDELKNRKHVGTSL